MQCDVITKTNQTHCFMCDRAFILLACSTTFNALMSRSFSHSILICNYAYCLCSIKLKLLQPVLALFFCTLADDPTPVGEVIENIASGAAGLGFDSVTGQIGHSVANGSPPL